MTEIEICLNCKKKTCYGDYPDCQRIEVRRKHSDAYKKLDKGEAYKLAGLLAKMQYKRNEISVLMGIEPKVALALLRHCLKKEYITREVFDATKIRG